MLEITKSSFLQEVHNVSLRHISGLYWARGKRILDVCLVLSSAIIVLPLIVILALFVMLDGHRPFYLQKRVGRNGQAFMLYKLRTMRPDNEKILMDHLAHCPEARTEWKKMQKLTHDPRITKFGSLLRKTSLDELPQLWNVLKGDMSLVGPRPIMVEQAAGYPGVAYYTLRPGITGPWQVSERNTVSFASRSTYDTDYFHNLRFGEDLKYILKTFKVIIHPTGR